MRLKKIMFGIALFATISGCQDSAQEDNPLLRDFTGVHQTPNFQKIKIEHYLPAVKIAIEEAKKEIDAIVNNPEKPTFENTIVALEYSGKRLGQILNIFYNLNEAETSPEMQAVAREISPLVTEHSIEISLNQTLFERVKMVYEQRQFLNLDEQDRMLLEKTYKGFVRNGANLAPELREQFKELNKELAKLSLQFSENELAETNNFILHLTNKEDLQGIPESVIEMAASEAKERNLEGWVFTLHYPSYLPFMQYSEKRELREKMFRAFTSRANRNNEYDNKQIVKDLVEKRLRKAQMLGYETYADYVLEERMAQSVSRVQSFLDQLFEASHKYAIKDKKEVETFARSLGFNDVLQRWDWMFFSEKLKKEKYSIDNEMIKPYFELSKVQQGIFDLVNKLYGLTFRYNTEISVYHPDVKAYEVYDETNRFMAVLYLDFHPRASKSSGAWMTSFREQYKLGDKDIRPLVSIVCNFTKPTETRPSLLTFDEMKTFLHEFGHALHGMLSDVKYESLSGTSVYRDFVELPSQIMENWGVEKQWLDIFATHYQTGEPIPAEYIEKLHSLDNFQAGYMSDRQVSFATLDLAWHTIKEPVKTDVEPFEAKALEKFELFPKVEGSCMSTSFSHLFAGGYAAGYYGYKWAEVLDADAFSLFKQNGIFDKATASRFREYILSKGGIQHPMKLYIAFRGQEPTIDALLERSGLTK